ncbi:hypothetical protein [Ponticoccus alexandrii]|uniref:Uncharacterized protein n=1 Tax=Ponticoccus alexandrii TaxID=1943633 RepID=A0ABX7F857_9RHOB|nr:hypothetical protein [Ponticoccus alexandrii]QRF66452.1 hypothetical protein GQA70_09100 [Ponticoccus alexandrii]
MARLIANHDDDYLIRSGAEPLVLGAKNWTQMIQRLLAGTDDGLKTGSTRANWYSIRRTFADWQDERVRDAVISAVMGPFDISKRTKPNFAKQATP